MTDIKIQCTKCGAKFFTLNREEIICTKCNNKIIVKDALKQNHDNKPSRDFTEEPLEDEVDDIFVLNQDED